MSRARIEKKKRKQRYEARAAEWLAFFDRIRSFSPEDRFRELLATQERMGIMSAEGREEALALLSTHSAESLFWFYGRSRRREVESDA